MTKILTKTVALATAFVFAVGACAPQGTGDADAPPREQLLAHPSTFGLDLTGSPVLEPKVMILWAPHVEALDPGITALEVTTDLDVVDGPGRAYETRLTIRGLGPDCGASGRLLVERDTRDLASATLPDAALLAAIVADLGDNRPTGRCGGGKGGHQHAGPFGNNFWLAQPCQEQDQREMASGTALELAIAAALADGTPSWAAACAEHAEPAGVAYCEDLVGIISGNLIQAEVRLEATRAISDLMDQITHEALEIAAAANLGFGGLANAVDVAELATMALEQVALKAAADSQASLVVGNLIAARAAAGMDPILAATQAPAVTGALIVMGNTWQVDMAELTECHRRIVAWIAAAAAIGVGFRLFGPGGPNLTGGGGPKWTEDTVLIAGPLRVQSLQFFFSHDVDIHVDQLPTAHQAMTRRTYGAYVSRVIYAGFEKPGYGHVLPADVVAPEPVTLVPMVIAPAGAGVELGHGGYGGPSQAVADTIYSPWANKVFLGAAGLDLNWQETDADGVPLSPVWALCEALPPNPVDPHYCDLGLTSTVPPWQIGQPLARYWRIYVTGGIVDPVDGAVIEPEGAQLFASLHAIGEGPASPCWVWDYGANDYVYEPSLPGCGPGPAPPGP